MPATIVMGLRRILPPVMLAALACAPGPGGRDEAAVAPAIERGVAYLERAVAGQPHGLALGYFLRRRFLLDAFVDAPSEYDAILSAASPAERRKHRTMPGPGALRLFRRLVTPENPFDEADLADAEGSLDLTTVRALYCDREPLPPDYPALLRTEAAAGAYRLTHAVLALAWLRDNGCASPLPASETARWLGDLAALVRRHPLHDVGFEAAALLAYLDAADRLPPGLVTRIVGAQDPDGGWHPCPAPPCDPPTGLRPERAASHWHPSALALWVLLETSTDRPADRFVPSAPPPAG